MPEAQSLLARMRELPLLERERAHAGALHALVRGEWHEASHRLDRILADDPLDILALQVGHVFDFFRGDSRNLRDRIGAGRPAWHREMPGYHAVLGMYAFGLEEMRRLRAGPSATAARPSTLEPRDGWAHHAVAHVMEMQGRVRDGSPG